MRRDPSAGDAYLAGRGFTASVYRKPSGLFVWKVARWQGGAITGDAPLRSGQAACDAAMRAVPTEWPQTETRIAPALNSLEVSISAMLTSHSAVSDRTGS